MVDKKIAHCCGTGCGSVSLCNPSNTNRRCILSSSFNFRRLWVFEWKKIVIRVIIIFMDLMSIYILHQIMAWNEILIGIIMAEQTKANKREYAV